MDEHNSRVLTIEDLAEYLKIPKSSLYKLAQEGKLPGQKVGRHWRFHQGAVEAWLKDNDARKIHGGDGVKGDTK